MKRANGSGTIAKLSGNRRKPYTIRRVIGWKENGNPIIKYQGYYRTRREAEKALNEYNADPYTISKKTLSDVYEDWYAAKETTMAEKTLNNYRTSFKHLKPLHDIKMKDIDRTVLQRFYDRIDTTGTSLAKVTSLLNMLFEYSVKRGILPVSALNLTKSVDIPIKESKAEKPRTAIDKADIDRLWTMTDDEYARITLFYIYTGLRFSELYNLTDDCWHENYIEIKKSKTKAGIRIVPICDKLKPFAPIKKVPNRTTFAREFKKLLPEHTIHETRHTFISMLSDAKTDIRVIQAIVGHAPNSVTDIYTHISLDVMLEAVNRI